MASSLPTYCGSLVAARFKQFPDRFVGLSDPVRGASFSSSGSVLQRAALPVDLWVSPTLFVGFLSTSGSVLQLAS